MPHRYHRSRWLMITVGIDEPSPRQYHLNQYGRLADALPRAKRRKGLTSNTLSVRSPRKPPVVRQAILVAPPQPIGASGAPAFNFEELLPFWDDETMQDSTSGESSVGQTYWEAANLAWEDI